MPRKKSAAKKAREAAAREAAKNAEISDKQPVREDVTQPESKHESHLGSASDSSSESESESEIEDEVGDLVTEEIEHGIQEVMNAIRSNDTKKLLDPSVRFFSDPDAVPATTGDNDKNKNEKPLYLKDYHRMNLLSGTAYQDDDGDDEEENREGVTIKTIDGKPSFVEMQKKEKEEILKEIQDAFNDTEKTGGNDGDDDDNNSSGSDDDDNDDFLRKKEVSKSTGSKPLTGNHTGSIPLPEATEENTDEFLQAYLDNQAWIPKPGDKMQLQPTNDSNLGDNDGAEGEGEEEEDDEEFDRAAENFENAYNFRYEDPNAAEIISYARNLASLRRSATSSRKRKRDEAKQVREAEKKEKEQEIQKRKTKTVNELSDLLERLKEEYGTELDEKMVERVASKLLNSDYSEDQWDSVLAELFDDEFYGEQGSEKPTWDDVEEYDEGEEEEEGEEDSDNNESDREEPPKKKKSKKQTLKEEKLRKRKEKQKLVNLVDKAVERNKLSIIEKVENERGRSRVKDEVKFRYREVSPESYGLSARDIFAAEDADLNEFISLKKFAPYRPQELKKKDKRKVTKPKRIAEWRKKVFHNENGPQFEEETGDLLIGTSENTDVGSKRHHRHRHKDHKRGHKRTKIDK